jgi:hypothetical protein
MSVVGHAPPPFFKRGPAPLVRLAFFVSLSLILLVADLRFHTLEWARLGGCDGGLAPATRDLDADRCRRRRRHLSRTPIDPA